VILRRTSYPLTEKYAKAAATTLKKSASGAGRLLKRKPFLTLGLIAAGGAFAALLVRGLEPRRGSGIDEEDIYS